MTYDVVIIGAGMSGLAAGIRLAYFDKKVLIVEKHSRIGGLNSYYSKNGYKLDVGLHAVTNFAKRGERKKPLTLLLKQLRIDYDELALIPQIRSAVRFDDAALYFSNDFDMLESEIAEKFPAQIDGFKKLTAYITSYSELDINSTESLSTRDVIGSHITDPLLKEMLLCPLMYYGNPKEDDMDFWQFVIMFKSIFMEGFARPREGVRRILKVLGDKYSVNGGELKLGVGVKRIIPETSGAMALELENGEAVRARKTLSSAGYNETMRLMDEDAGRDKIAPGRMSFMESIYILNKVPSELGINETITFYSSGGGMFDYKAPDSLIDETSGVICSPDNFAYDSPLGDNMIRITNIANYSLWRQLEGNEYKTRKNEAMRRSLDAVKKYIGDFRESVTFSDSFTPTTIERFTGHINGAVYGIEEKIRLGKTDVDGLFICGTDQGFLGITGAMLSGITIANLYLLK